MSIERIESDGELLAVVIRKDYAPEHIDFLTSEKEGLQLGFHQRKQGERVRAHHSLPFQNLSYLPANKIYQLQQGKADIDIYDGDGSPVTTVVLQAGDTIIFITGAHGVTFTEDSQMMEIKQGPYRQRDQEKRFIE